MINTPVRVFETDLDPVLLGDDEGGWVSGSPKNLAIAGSVNCLFDLGQFWFNYSEINVTFSAGNATSTGIIMVGLSSPNGVDKFFNHGLAGSTSANSTAYVGPLSAVNGAQTSRQRPQGRYVRFSISGIAVAALGASAVLRLSLHP